MNPKSQTHRLIAIITLSLIAASFNSATAGVAENTDSAPIDSASTSAPSSIANTDAECWKNAAENIDTLNFASAAILTLPSTDKNLACDYYTNT